MCGGEWWRFCTYLTVSVVALDDFTQKLLDFLERFPLGFDNVFVRINGTGEIDRREQTEHDVVPVVAMDQQKHFVGDERKERQRHRHNDRTVRTDVHGKHFA